VRKRSQLKNKLVGLDQAKQKAGEVMDVKEPENFKGVRKEKRAA
jgi:hypothetical protein